MKSLMIVVVLMLVPGCLGTRTDLDTCDAVFPGPEYVPTAETVPVCPWHVEVYSCESFEDYNLDGHHNLDDMADFCETMFGERGYAYDVSNPEDAREDWNWCITCY